MKNILLLFLSDVKIYGGVVSKATYKEIGETETTNESSVRYLSKIKKAPPDKIFYFASKKVKAPIENFKVAGKEISHVEYFANCIKHDVVGDIETVMQECEFDETANMSKTMESVIDMASKIQKYIETQKVSEVTLHVDMTGGMRHASLMMLVITRLIQYSGVKMGYVLYSNFDRDRPKRGELQFVEEANEIYNLFDLIAGAEEFVRFGSVDAIQNYFKGKKDLPTVLQNLLEAMKKFAEAIKISRRSEFQAALEGLQNAYEKFNAESGKISSLNYNLMQQMKSRISQEYAELLKNAADDYFSIINWCLDHGYLQQALTLYTECFPYMLITKDKIIDVDENLKSVVIKQAEKDRMNREWEYLLLNESDPEGYETIFETYKNFIHEIKSAIVLIKSNQPYMDAFNDDNRKDWISKGIISWDFDEYISLLNDLQKLKSNPNLANDFDTIEKNLKTLYSFWNFIPKDIFKKPVLERVEEILAAFAPIKADKFRKTNSNTLITHYMIMNNMLKVKIDEKKLLPIIERYFIVKVERNDIAHARLTPKEEASTSNSEKTHAEFLKDYMKQGLKEYSDII